MRTHHGRDHPADVDGVTSSLQVLLGVALGLVGVVQDLEADVHHVVLKLGGKIEDKKTQQRGESSVFHLLFHLKNLS